MVEIKKFNCINGGCETQCKDCKDFDSFYAGSEQPQHTTKETSEEERIRINQYLRNVIHDKNWIFWGDKIYTEIIEPLKKENEELKRYKDLYDESTGAIELQTRIRKLEYELKKEELVIQSQQALYESLVSQLNTKIKELESNGK